MTNRILPAIRHARPIGGMIFWAVLAFGLCAAVPAKAQDSKPVRRGAITVSQTADAQPRNILTLRAGNSPWVKNVFETLTQTDPKTFEVKPLLAKSWKAAADGLSMEIVLRDDVTFHTGRRMTADDVKFTLETMALPETAAQVGFIAKEFQSIDVTSPTTLTIKFKKPLANIFDLFEEANVIDKETYTKREDGSQVIGTGPFKFAKWTPGASIMLERYTGYRDRNLPYLDSIEFAIITDSTASVSALRSGRSVMATGLSQNDLVEFEGNPQYQFLNSGGAIYPFGVNVTKAPFDKKEVRQALGYAIDRQRINEQVFGGIGTPTDLFWGVGSPGYGEEQANRYSYDPTKAKALIEKAGATGAKVPIIVPSIPANRSIFEIVQNNLKEIGLAPEAVVLDVADFDKRQVAGDLGPAFLLIHGQVGFSTATLLSSLPSLRQGNPSGFWSDQYVTLRNAVTAANSPDATDKAVKALSDYMLDEAFSLSLLQTPGQTILSDTLKGVKATLRSQMLYGEAYLAE
ncbi:ABC transporter substrate-binding protein [Neorhizobium sp. BETTINA12A]|uniref:ABC transporter substrate-binding protein n=1 Tax=Neorhizobium sp. BETTINA12A TaxID=2908924 RepID=UPI001FF35AEA|nr:ABC transporter substrate-binding protein [Neorhizobium sp. BETTINA12A]MCJ9751641.1 ABC transporter substrate-binding protein [Neorhizobium sp. BETTINA12A]